MIIEFYFLIEILILLLLFLGWFKEHPIFWVLGFVFSAVQIFTSYNIEYVVMVYDGTLSSEIISMSYPVLSFINMLFLAICLIMLFADIFTNKSGYNR